eukprot:4857081-Prymnesium_polylepis.1
MKHRTCVIESLPGRLLCTAKSQGRYSSLRKALKEASSALTILSSGSNKLARSVIDPGLISLVVLSV